MYVDTHAHIYLKDFADDRHQMIQRARDNGIERIYMPNIDSSSIADVLFMAEQYPDICFAQMGLHPCYVKADYKKQLEIIYNEFSQSKISAVGEIGIDLYWDKTFVKEQELAFVQQIEWSKDLDLPIVIHSRESLDLTIAQVEKMQDGSLSGIFHCFNGSIEQAQRIIDLGFFMGLGGVISFKNANLEPMLSKINLDHFVLETDAPYLAPVPYRGKRNESAYILDIARKLSEIKEISMEEIEKTTTRNANKVYQYAP